MSESKRGGSAASQSAVRHVSELLRKLSPEERVGLLAEAFVEELASEGDSVLGDFSGLFERNLLQAQEQSEYDSLESPKKKIHLGAGQFGHVDHGKTTLTAEITRILHNQRQDDPAAAPQTKSTDADASNATSEADGSQEPGTLEESGTKSRHAEITLDTPELVAYHDVVKRRIEERRSLLRSRRDHDDTEGRIN